jgi:GNAT superfamily N-acetyltransferase
MNQFRIEEAGAGRGAVAEGILRALPEWFGIESSIIEYRQDIEQLPTWFCVLPGGEIVGFVALNYHNLFTAEIHVIGVRPQFHGKGIGRALVKRAESVAAERSIEYLEVKTLGPSRPNRSYAGTREFYFRMGFRPIEEISSVWPGYPCLIMVKKIGSRDASSDL